MMFFLILSSASPLLLLIALSPSSLYSPIFSFPINLNNFSRRHKSTSSQISAPPKLSIVTSNNVYSPFLTQVPSLLKSNDFLGSIIVLMTLPSIFVNDLAYSTDLCKRFFEMDG